MVRGRSVVVSSPRRWSPRSRRLTAWSVGLLLAAGVAAAVADAWRVSQRFPIASFRQPSRLYGRSLELTPGASCRLADLAGQLARQGYEREPAEAAAAPGPPTVADGGAAGPGAAAGEAAPRPGTYRLLGETLSVGLRRFPTPAGWDGGRPLVIEVRAGQVARLLDAGQPVARAAIEPPLLASFYGPAVEERWPVRLDELPPQVVQAVLAAEDDGFFHHSGLSARAIARAAWVDLRGRGLRQGGSTITQQLVRTLYLSRRRSLLRKTREALLAEVVELRHDKRSILETYLNSISWGHSGPANLVGLGAAARTWFGKPPQELDLAQAAALAAMIRSPAEYSPVTHAAALVQRRNRVLARLADLGWADRGQVSRAQAEPLGALRRPLEPRPCAPWFADLAAQEARRRFGVEDLAGGGYQLFATLDAGEQQRAEAALNAELAVLSERAAGRDGPAPAPVPAPAARQEQRERRRLEAALISVDPRDGGILAYVGGRDRRRSQFDRLAQARRPLGSAFKPVVYAAAFDSGVATPATLLADSPVLVRAGGALWQPQNYDRAFRGWVTAAGALEQSLNVPTVRLALAVGLHRIASLAEAMGLGGPPAAVPALALGAVEASPLAVARMYSTLATLGLRPTLHGLDTVRDRNGIVLAGEELPPPQRVLPAPTAYLVTSLLQGAVDHGTASAVRRQGLADPLAGKTGTTNDRRDSWFAGYSPDRVTVVWVGYDDDAETRFSGATAAVPLWSRFMLAVRPAGGFPAFAPPPGLIDAEPAEPGATIATAPLVMPASFHESTLEAPAGGAAWYEPPVDPAANGDRRGVILIRRHDGP
jgi:penicillin-binding protein 1B